MTDEQALAEGAAVRERYARRAHLPADRYSPFQPDVILRAQARERALILLLKQNDVLPVDGKTVLEMGCGEGINLLQLIRLGFNPARLVGNDLREDALAVARRILPSSVRLLAGEASGLALEAASFDIVTQATMFSSILDLALQQAVATHMWTLTKPGGAVLWYDFAYDNPFNADVRGVPLSRIRTLFPAGRITARRLTLAPPLARRVAAIHPGLYSLLDAVPFLRTHLLCWIQKP